MCEQFIDKQLSLIQLERQAEIDEEKKIKSSSSLRQLHKSGLALTRLVVSERKTGLLGRSMVYLRPIGLSDELPHSNFSNGQIVAIYQTHDISADPGATGVIQRISKKEIFVALDKTDVDLNENSPTSVVMWTSDVTYKRLRIAAEKLKEHLQKRNRMIELLLENGEPAPPNQHLPPFCRSNNGKLMLLNDQLDDSQVAAVDFALRQNDLAVIHGPPGTGKTTTIIEIICQAVKSGAKILACAPSNVAVDNMVERLAKRKIRLVRLGHTARSEETLQKYSLDAILDSSDSHKIIRDVRSDITQAIKDMKSRRRGASENIKSLRKELERRERAALRDVLTSTDVVLSTLTSAHDHGPLRNVPEEFFDYIVIDECSQATELSCWIALPRAKKVILAGDPWQLPPTIISPKAAKQGLALSLMERVIKKFGDKVTRMLTVQYRMHSHIMAWSSEAMYKARLTAHSSVKEHLLKDLPGVDDTEDTSCPLVLIDTAGADLFELVQEDDERSRSNPAEAKIVGEHISRLISAGVPANDIAVITPYNLQVETIRNLLISDYPEIEVRSVDGYQGREKEAIVMSMVRSNDDRSVGFLAEERRLNVAVTRARRHFCVVCDVETVGSNKFIKGLIDHITNFGEVRSAFEYEMSLPTH